MESLQALYRIGQGPSSSHTMGPGNAARTMRERYPEADSFDVVLYGSLAKTGKGHLTDQAILQGLAPVKTTLRLNLETPEENLGHPNTMDVTALKNGQVLGTQRIYSVGGGKICLEGEEKTEAKQVYPLSSFTAIKAACIERNFRLWQYVEQWEGPEIWAFLDKVWRQMKETVQNGLKAEGVLHGGLDVQRKARFLYQQRHIDESAQTRENRLVSAYAFATSEENAAGGVVVTAPTCGASGVLPAVMLYEQQNKGFSDEEVLHALATAGLVGNVIKTNASISGAECGCQAEVGSACSMAAAGLAELFGMGMEQIEYAAEVAMEHHLGLTCDPIAGLVQIPCIERNAVGAMRAINALSLANFLTNTRKISFDMVVETMYETGRDLFSKYRETSEGGLAKMYRHPNGEGKNS